MTGNSAEMRDDGSEMTHDGPEMGFDRAEMKNDGIEMTFDETEIENECLRIVSVREYIAVPSKDLKVHRKREV